MFSRQVLQQLTYWEEKRSQSPHYTAIYYNISNPIILVELSEIEARLIAKQHEFQLQMNIYQQRKPDKQENVLMTLSDALLQAIQQWMTNRQVLLTSKCNLSLHAAEPLPLPLRKCLIVLLSIPVYTFYRSSIQATRKIMARLDAMSFYLLLARLQNPKMELKLIVTIY